MKFYNVTKADLLKAAEAVPCYLTNFTPTRTYCQAVLRPTPDTPTSLRKTGHNGRRVHALNYEGHRLFFTALYDLCPSARIIIGRARYAGNMSYGVIYNNRDDFYRKHSEVMPDAGRY